MIVFGVNPAIQIFETYRIKKHILLSDVFL